MPELRPLPESVARAVSRYDLVTNLVCAVLLVGPFAVPILLLGRQAEEWPDGWWKLVFLLPFLGTPAWAVLREWGIHYWWRCPECSGRMRAEKRPGPRGTVLLACPRCLVRWDTGREFPEVRHDYRGEGRCPRFSRTDRSGAGRTGSAS